MLGFRPLSVVPISSLQLGTPPAPPSTVIVLQAMRILQPKVP